MYMIKKAFPSQRLPMGHHNLNNMAKKAKKWAKYSNLQDYLGKELPINAAQLKLLCYCLHH